MTKSRNTAAYRFATSDTPTRCQHRGYSNVPASPIQTSLAIRALSRVGAQAPALLPRAVSNSLMGEE